MKYAAEKKKKKKKGSGLEGSQADGRNDPMMGKGILSKETKCDFDQTSIVCPNQQNSHNKVQPLTDNTHAILLTEQPLNAKELRSFLGKVNYYHRFIPNKSKILEPLQRLLRKNQPFAWNGETQDALDQIKSILTSQPALRIFDPELEIKLYTDASRMRVDAVLKQIQQQQEELPVGYFSRRLLSYQCNYSVTELELLAILESIEYWHYYLYGREFKVITDHLPLKGLQRHTKPNTRLFNWAMRLNQYRFTIHYRPGILNEEADYLSRHPVQELIDSTKEQTKAIMAMNIMTQPTEPTIDGKMVTELQAPYLTNPPEGYTVHGKEIVRGTKNGVKWFLPKGVALTELRKIHDAKGHIGISKMILHLTRQFNTPRIYELAKRVTLECETCQRTKPETTKHGFLGQIGPADETLISFISIPLEDSINMDLPRNIGIWQSMHLVALYGQQHQKHKRESTLST